MKLYTTAGAPNPERVRFFMLEKDIQDRVERVEMSIMEGEHRKAEYRAISPFGELPALELDDGTVLTESRAICSYLESEYPTPYLMGETGKERALIEMWDRRMEFRFLVPIAMWVRHGHPAVSQLEGEDATPQWSAVNEKRVHNMAAWLSQHLSSHRYIAGDRFTIADITAYVACGFVRLMKFNPVKEFAPIGEWADRLSSRPMLSDKVS